MKGSLQPSLPVAVKLASLAVHVEEFLSPGGHDFDRSAIETLLRDVDVQEYLLLLDAAALIPKRRGP